MKKTIIILILTMVILSPIVLATEDCERCHTEVKVKAKMKEIEVSHDYSKLLIFGKVKNIGDYPAMNTWVKLHYTPDDYEMGPEIDVFPCITYPLGIVWKDSWKPFFFIVELEDFYPFGPFPVDDLEDGMSFYVTAAGDNFNYRKSQVMEFECIEEAEPIPLEEPEEIEETTEEEIVEEELVKPIKRKIKKVDLNKVKLF